MARGIYRYTDPVMDLLFPLPSNKDRALWKMARVAYLPVLVGMGLLWAAFTVSMMSQQGVASGQINLTSDETMQLWGLLAASMVIGWMLIRTSGVAMGSKGEALTVFNMIATAVLLVLATPFMVMVGLIALGTFQVAAVLALCWGIVAGSLLWSFRGSD